MPVIYKTIGGGGDYADIGTAWSALPAITADHYTFTQISNFTEATGVPSVSKDLNGKRILFTNNDRYEITNNNKPYKFVNSSSLGLGNEVALENLTIKQTLIAASTFPMIQFVPNSAPSNKICTLTLNNLKLLGKNKSGIGNVGIIPILGANHIKISNCIITGFNQGILLYNYFMTVNPTINNLIENCSLYDNWYGFDSFGPNPTTAIKYLKCINVVIAGSAGQDWSNSAVGGHPHNRFTNCADSDGSLIGIVGVVTDCKSNIIPANEFESLVSTSSDFLKLKLIDAYARISGTPRIGSAQLKVKFNSDVEYSAPGKILPAGGIIPTLETNDLDDKQYGEFGMYPIGCYNAQPKTFGEIWET